MNNYSVQSAKKTKMPTLIVESASAVHRYTKKKCTIITDDAALVIENKRISSPRRESGEATVGRPARSHPLCCSVRP